MINPEDHPKGGLLPSVARVPVGGLLRVGQDIVNLSGTAFRVFYTNSAGAVTELALGTANTMLQSNGASAAPSFGIGSGMVVESRDMSENDVVSSTTETTTFTYTLPANTLGATGALAFWVWGDFLNNTALPATVRLKWKFGATTIQDTGAQSIVISATRRGWVFLGWLANVNATNAQRVYGLALMNDVGVAGVMTNLLAAGVGAFVMGGYHNAVAIDTTANVDVVFTVQLGTNDALISCRTQAAMLLRA